MNNNTNEAMGTTVEHTLTIKVKAGNIFDARAKIKNLEKFASLEMEHQERIEKLINNPKALAGLKKYEKMLNDMFK